MYMCCKNMARKETPRGSKLKGKNSYEDRKERDW